MPQQSGEPPFRKFKLVPVGDQRETNSSSSSKCDMEQLERSLRKYDPKIRAQANYYKSMLDALYNNKTERLTPSQQLHIYSANRSRIQQLRNPTMETSDESLPIKHLEPEYEMNVNRRGAEQEEEQEERKYKPQSDAGAVNIPKKFQARFQNVLDQTSDTIQANNRGELVIKGRELPNTSYADTMRALYVDSKFFVPGLTEVVHELKRTGVTLNLLASKRAKNMYSQSNVGGKVAQSGSGKPCRILRLY